jgi:hypothetical protein
MTAPFALQFYFSSEQRGRQKINVEKLLEWKKNEGYDAQMKRNHRRPAAKSGGAAQFGLGHRLESMWPLCVCA